MKEILIDYKEKIKDLINNKKYMLTIIIVAILGYGYYITNVSIGMDDTCLDRYYGTVFSENMICYGRWGGYLLYKALGLTYFTPFWVETLTVLIMLCTAIFISAFIMKNIKKNDIKISIVFSCIYLSYSIINEPLIFQASNLAYVLNNLLIIVTIILWYEIFKTNVKLKFKYMLIIFIVTATAISMYEACCQTYIAGLLICMLILIIKDKKDSKDIFQFFAKGIGILIVSIILYYVILKLFYIIGIPNNLSGGRTIYWFQNGIINGIKILSKNIIEYTINRISYFPVLELLVCAIIGLILSIYISVKRKNVYIFDIYILLVISNFALSILQCKQILYRTCISWNLFVATIVTAVIILFQNTKNIKRICYVFVVLLVLWQTRDLNQWFYNEDVKYQNDIYMGHYIANDIMKNTNYKSKPIVFAGLYKDKIGVENQIGAQSNGFTMFNWGPRAFDDNSYELIKFFRMLGYVFKAPNAEQWNRGNELASEMEKYPKDGYIKEYDDIIVVKLGEKL